MRYFKNQLKDEEIPTLLFLMEDLLDTTFGKEYSYIETNDIDKFIAQTDSSDSDIKPISNTVIKDMLGMTDFDTGYRPKYKSIEFVIFGLLGMKRSFFNYQKDHRLDIESYFKALDYTIAVKNPQKSSIVKSKTQKQIAIANRNLSIDTSLGVVRNVLDIVKLVVGDFEKSVKESKTKNSIGYRNPRINKRLDLNQERKQKNIEQITRKALLFAKEKEKTNEKVHLDWVADFFDQAENCSDKKLQYLWAKLLSGEVESPGKYSRRTMFTIKMLNQKHALMFGTICRCIWTLKDSYAGDEKIFILDHHYYQDYKFEEEFGFEVNYLEELESIGLLKLSYTELLNSEEFTVTFFEKEHIIACSNKFELGYAGLTTVGEELLELIDPKPLKDYYEKCIELFRDKNILKQ